MSIRLRLTLLYSGILALTLIAFSVMLYLTQARTILNDSQKNLARAAEFLIDGPLTHRPMDKAFKLVPYRIGIMAQIRTPEGDIIERSPNLGDALMLPWSDAARQATQQGQTWVEVGWIETERLLIHNQPFTAETGEPFVLQMASSLADQDRDLHSLGQILVVGSSLAIVAAFGIGWLVAGVTLRPISRLRHTAQAIGAARDFDRRVEQTGPNDEIGQLAATFNDMLAELQAAYLQVEETLQAQRRFVADASHELRTPLTTLRGNLGLLQREPPISAEDRADVLVDMTEETERLMRLVNELLVLARADAGRSLRQEPVPLKPLVDDVVQQVQILAPQRSIACQTDPAAVIKGDGDALRQVLLALLDNAIQHTPPEARIALATTSHNGHITIQVSDDGPGIAPAHVPHLFERFYRGDAARTSPGTGLGLAIAYELTQAQQGRLTLESEVGRGTTFILTFPQAAC